MSYTVEVPYTYRSLLGKQIGNKKFKVDTESQSKAREKAREQVETLPSVTEVHGTFLHEV